MEDYSNPVAVDRFVAVADHVDKTAKQMRWFACRYRLRAPVAADRCAVEVLSTI